MPDITVPSLPDFTGTSISNFSTEILQKLSKFQAQTANLNTQILQNLDHFQAQIKAISRATQAWRLIDTAFVIAFVLFFLFLVALFSRDAEIEATLDDFRNDSWQTRIKESILAQLRGEIRSCRCRQAEPEQQAVADGGGEQAAPAQPEQNEQPNDTETDGRAAAQGQGEARVEEQGSIVDERIAAARAPVLEQMRQLEADHREHSNSHTVQAGESTKQEDAKARQQQQQITTMVNERVAHEFTESDTAMVNLESRVDALETQARDRSWINTSLIPSVEKKFEGYLKDQEKRLEKRIEDRVSEATFGSTSPPQQIGDPDTQHPCCEDCGELLLRLQGHEVVSNRRLNAFENRNEDVSNRRFDALEANFNEGGTCDDLWQNCFNMDQRLKALEQTSGSVDEKVESTSQSGSKDAEADVEDFEPPTNVPVSHLTLETVTADLNTQLRTYFEEYKKSTEAALTSLSDKVDKLEGAPANNSWTEDLDKRIQDSISGGIAAQPKPESSNLEDLKGYLYALEDKIDLKETKEDVSKAISTEMKMLKATTIMKIEDRLDTLEVSSTAVELMVKDAFRKLNKQIAAITKAEPTDLGPVTTRLDALENANKSRDDSAKDLEKRLRDSLKTDIDAIPSYDCKPVDLSPIKGRVDALEQSNNSRDQATQKLVNGLESIKTAVAEVRSCECDHSPINKRLDAVENDKSTTDRFAELESFTNRLNGLEQQQAERKTRTDALEVKTKTHTKEINDVKFQGEQASKQIKSTAASVEATNERFGEFQREISAISGQVDGIKTRTGIIEKKLKEIEDHVADDWTFMNDILNSDNNLAADFEARFPREHGGEVNEEPGSRSPRGSQDGDGSDRGENVRHERDITPENGYGNGYLRQRGLDETPEQTNKRGREEVDAQDFRKSVGFAHRTIDELQVGKLVSI
jgi:hypothetical protein